MRLRILIFILPFTLTKVLGQIDVELYFKSSCNDSTYKLTYSLYDKVSKGQYINSVENKVTVPKASSYHLYISFVMGDYVHSFDHDMAIQAKLVDTLLIPKITFTTGAELHSNFWSYFSCEKICNGTERDFYENGNKRSEGDFIAGKPKWMVEYRTNGTKRFEYWYKPGNYFPDRLNKYDDNGRLDEYEIKEFKKGRAITLTYDANNKLLDRHVEKY